MGILNQVQGTGFHTPGNHLAVELVAVPGVQELVVALIFPVVIVSHQHDPVSPGAVSLTPLVGQDLVDDIAQFLAVPNRQAAYQNLAEPVAGKLAVVAVPGPHLLRFVELQGIVGLIGRDQVAPGAQEIPVIVGAVAHEQQIGGGWRGCIQVGVLHKVMQGHGIAHAVAELLEHILYGHGANPAAGTLPPAAGLIPEVQVLALPLDQGFQGGQEVAGRHDQQVRPFGPLAQGKGGTPGHYRGPVHRGHRHVGGRGGGGANPHGRIAQGQGPVEPRCQFSLARHLFHHPPCVGQAEGKVQKPGRPGGVQEQGMVRMGLPRGVRELNVVQVREVRNPLIVGRPQHQFQGVVRAQGHRGFQQACLDTRKTHLLQQAVVKPQFHDAIGFKPTDDLAPEHTLGPGHGGRIQVHGQRELGKGGALIADQGFSLPPQALFGDVDEVFLVAIPGGKGFGIQVVAELGDPLLFHYLGRFLGPQGEPEHQGVGVGVAVKGPGVLVPSVQGHAGVVEEQGIAGAEHAVVTVLEQEGHRAERWHQGIGHARRQGVGPQGKQV